MPPAPNEPVSDNLLSQAASPFSILKQAIKRVPSLKFALGIVGLAASVALIKSLITDLRLALFGIIVMLVLMSVLFVFAKLTSVAPKEFKRPAITLLWFSLIITMIAASLLFMSVFFNWPINLRHWLTNKSRMPEQSSTQLQPKTTYLRGMVRDSSTNEGLTNATIEVELLPGEHYTTTSNGDFLIEGIPGMPGDSARIYVRKDSYAQRDEHVTLPGPKTIYLDKLPPASPVPTKTQMQKNNQNNNERIDRILKSRNSNKPT